MCSLVSHGMSLLRAQVVALLPSSFVEGVEQEHVMRVNHEGGYAMMHVHLGGIRMLPLVYVCVPPVSRPTLNSVQGGQGTVRRLSYTEINNYTQTDEGLMLSLTEESLVFACDEPLLLKTWIDGCIASVLNSGSVGTDTTSVTARVLPQFTGVDEQTHTYINFETHNCT